LISSVGGSNFNKRMTPCHTPTSKKWTQDECSGISISLKMIGKDQTKQWISCAWHEKKQPDYFIFLFFYLLDSIHESVKMFFLCFFFLVVCCCCCCCCVGVYIRYSMCNRISSLHSRFFLLLIHLLQALLLIRHVIEKKSLPGFSPI
jgi:hypothetical protein